MDEAHNKLLERLRTYYGDDLACRTLLMDARHALEALAGDRDRTRADYETMKAHNKELFGKLSAAELERDRLAGEVERLRNLLKHAELDCHKARFALQTIGESTVPDQPASSGLTELEHVQHHHTQIRRLAIMTLRPEAIGIYEAPRREADEIRVRGVGRDLFEPRSVRVALTERPTDDEIKSIHNWMRGWKL